MLWLDLHFELGIRVRVKDFRKLYVHKVSRLIQIDEERKDLSFKEGSLVYWNFYLLNLYQDWLFDHKRFINCFYCYCFDYYHCSNWRRYISADKIDLLLNAKLALCSLYLDFDLEQ
jgi:hypothetical protein